MNEPQYKMNIVIQGGLYPSTIKTAHHYAELDLVEKVVISTWENEAVEQEDIKSQKLVLVKNKKPDYAGPGNLNLHLLSSREGVARCENGVILKIRSDEILSHEGLITWFDYFKKHDNGNTLNYLDGEKQLSKIAVIAMNITYPYHPQDHVFIGYKKDLTKLFNMPFSNEKEFGPEPVDFTKNLRNNIYIGANYFSLFFEEPAKHFENWRSYLVDNSEHRGDSMDFYLNNLDSIFFPLPVVDMGWEKFHTQYWWEGYGQYGDIYADKGYGDYQNIYAENNYGKKT
tara:strand:- start:1650 stop:2504 length:855 start_codon:yes stop_codon:yes gene_type:complete